jgi:hypothetical protein
LQQPLSRTEHKGDARPNTLVHLNVRDIDAVSQEFGIPVDDAGLAGRECHLEDPDGNRLRVSEVREVAASGPDGDFDPREHLGQPLLIAEWMNLGERAARVFRALHRGRKRLLGLGGAGVLWLLVGEGEGCAGRDACKRGVQRLGVDLFEAWL